MIFVAVDIGGTFTDLIGFDDGSRAFVQAKSLSTPADLTLGVINCLRERGLDAGKIDELIHGSTVAINTLIERKGANTGLVVTRGTRDVYVIGRGNRPESYNLFFHRHRPLVSRRLTLEVAERMLAGGEVCTPLNKANVAEACKVLKANGIEAVAVCFLHAYANPDHERIAGAMIRKAMPQAYVSLSHEILREYREFERLSTTVVNAYIGPKVGGYVKNLKASLGRIGFAGDLSIMRSNGGVMTPEVATARPVAMMESGPVGGIIASARVGVQLGFPNVISFDMGGTTAKASLVRAGEPTLAPGYYVGGYSSGHPVMLPMIDVVEVGAGGGSIAWRDDVGALKVGPHSSGADPGPICYAAGGDGADHNRCQCRARQARPRQLSRRHHEARCCRRRARHQKENSRPVEASNDCSGASHYRHRQLQNVAGCARGVGRKRLRSPRLCIGGLGRSGTAARLRRRA
jgi:N-methylhydantoinase A